ncbi:MAG TPA: SDR family oxidoreductase [Methylomirabilota bacterium]|jgi:NAD(P)-dependent dehydrogenase (short-subunit alcohol dehydrogenase family)
MGVLLVTGGSRGIGAAIAKTAAKKGYDVCVNYLSARERADEVAAAVRAEGRRALVVQADVSREDDIVAMFRAVDRELGPIDALVNNAGVDYERLVADVERTGVERVFGINVIGLILCCREAVRRMSQDHGGRGGTIVNVSSVAARTGGLPKDAVYTASKGAVDAFTRGLSNEVAGQGVRVCAVRPGLTLTEIFESTLGQEGATELARRAVPMGRIGRPDEVAAMVLWLCSPEASYVTGFTYDVSGGR